MLLRHALRNSLVVFVPLLLTDFGAIFGASLAIDLLFSLNGIGSMLFGVLNTNSQVPIVDTYAVQLLLLVGGGFMFVASLLGELAIEWIDPRLGFR